MEKTGYWSMLSPFGQSKLPRTQHLFGPEVGLNTLIQQVSRLPYRKILRVLRKYYSGRAIFRSKISFHLYVLK